MKDLLEPQSVYEVDSGLAYMAGSDSDDPKAPEGTILGVVDAGLYVGRAPASSIRRIAFMLAGGASAMSVFGARGLFVEWTAFVGLERTDGSRELELIYRAGADEKPMQVSLETDGDAGRAYATVRERCGATVTESVRNASRVLAVSKALVALVIIAGLGFGFHMVAAAPMGRVRGKRAIFSFLAHLLGPTGVVVVSALLGAFVVLWLVVFLLDPPKVHTMRRTP